MSTRNIHGNICYTAVAIYKKGPLGILSWVSANREGHKMKKKDGGGREIGEMRDSVLLHTRQKEREREKERWGKRETECLWERSEMIQLMRDRIILFLTPKPHTHTRVAAAK